MNGQWKDVPNYEGLYQVSNTGKVRSLDRYVYVENQGQRFRKGQELKQAFGKRKHLYVTLSNASTEKTFYVHSLVMLAFVGPRPKDLEVCHGIGGVMDNSLSNLSYGTRSKNMLDKQRDGTDFQSNKINCPNGHKLIEPNLVAWRLKKGHRLCLSCERARLKLTQQQKRKGISFTDSDKKLLSDEYYQTLTNERLYNE